MLTFEKVLEIFADYLTADETIEVYISRHGCVRVEFDQDFHYCSGEVCHTPKELFNLLADDYRTYLEIELTKGKREVTEDDEREADALYKQYLDRKRGNLYRHVCRSPCNSFYQCICGLQNAEEAV